MASSHARWRLGVDELATTRVKIDGQASKRAPSTPLGDMTRPDSAPGVHRSGHGSYGVTQGQRGQSGSVGVTGVTGVRSG